MDIENKILTIAKQYTKNPEVSMMSEIKQDLKMDSLSLTEFLVALEDEFEIEIDIDDPSIDKVKSLRDIWLVVTRIVDSK